MIWIGDDWAEDHHDVEILGEDGRRLARVRLPEGLEGITRLHALIAVERDFGRQIADSWLGLARWSWRRGSQTFPAPLVAGGLAERPRAEVSSIVRR